MSEDGPRMAADYDLVFADWDANTERLISIMSAHLPVARGTLLDATCRTGMACDAAVRMGWSGIGADAAPAMLERARARLPDLDFRVTDVRRLYEGIGQSVDAVISIGDGLPALARNELGTAVAEMRRCTRPGGTAMIVVRDFVGSLRPRCGATTRCARSPPSSRLVARARSPTRSRSRTPTGQARTRASCRSCRSWSCGR
jgi:SAM-dependent methyltransferase